MSTHVSPLRLGLLRATYLLMVIGLAVAIWPSVLSHSLAVPRMSGVATSMLAAISLLAAIGLRYPLQMLPVLFFEMFWKAIWLLAYALPLWRAGQMDAATLQTVHECLPVIIFPIVIPWGHVMERYIRQPGDPWGRRLADPVLPDR